METLCGILIPFLGTTLGAACVFFMKKAMNDQVRRALTGFAAGVMVAASIWSLLIPAIDQCAPMGKWAFFALVPGILGGDSVPTAARSHHPAPAPEECGKRGAAQQLGTLGDDAAGGDAA
jgi:zinc transporter ZupT